MKVDSRIVLTFSEILKKNENLDDYTKEKSSELTPKTFF